MRARSKRLCHNLVQALAQSNCLIMGIAKRARDARDDDQRFVPFEAEEEQTIDKTTDKNLEFLDCERADSLTTGAIWLGQYHKVGQSKDNSQ